MKGSMRNVKQKRINYIFRTLNYAGKKIYKLESK